MALQGSMLICSVLKDELLLEIMNWKSFTYGNNLRLHIQNAIIRFYKIVSYIGLRFKLTQNMVNNWK